MAPETAEKKVYDMIILGAGPAGLTAAIYGDANLDVLVLEHMISGGEIANSERLDNYPGFPEGISGVEFGQLLEKQAARFGAEIIPASIEEADIHGEIKKVTSSMGNFYGRTIIVATGTSLVCWEFRERTLFAGGLSFCATCDGPFFRDGRIAVIGGGDSAVKEALYLTRFAEKIFLIHRRDKLRAVPFCRNRFLTIPGWRFSGIQW